MSGVARPIQAGDLIDARFRVEAWAGAGGMSTVYRGRDEARGEVVAIKVLGAQEAGAVERFTREAALLAELHHPGIVRYVAHGRASDGAYYLAMEWLDGEPLSARLRKRGLTLGESLSLVAAAAGALGEAHARGIVHRDVNPRNLFLLRDGGPGDVKLLDFGIARLSSHELERTGAGTILGTPGYMAPEQARGERDVGAAADVFSLGCVFFECVTGRPPFAGEKAMAVLAKILLDEAPRVTELVPDTPPAIDQLLAQLLAKDPRARPADGNALRALIAAIDVAPLDRVARAAAPPPALTDVEQRLLCVIFADGGGSVIDRLLAAVAPYGGTLDRLAGGAVLWSLASGGVASDQAQRAAECALAFRQALPGAAIAVATGRGMLSSEGSAGEVIDRAARLIDQSRGGDVKLDDVTAALLGPGFDVAGSARGLVLRGRREVVEPVRTLLGCATPCVGRDRELAGLEALFDECVEEPVAKVALVTAPAGGGKSRVRYELVRRLRARDRPLEIWLGRGDPMRVGSPFGLLAPAIRRALNIRDGEPQAIREHKLCARLARHFSDEPTLRRVSAFVGELCGVHLGDDSHAQLRAARRDPVLMNDQMRQAWEDWLAAECRTQPMLLVLEDLHWGDLPTVRFIDSALRNLRDLPLIVLALARPDVHDLFPKLWHERAVWEIKLAPLGKRAAQSLVRAVLGDIAPHEIDALVAQAEGNPLYLEELVRTVAETGAQALPESVLAMVLARLERLETDARRVLRAASVFGQAFWRGGVHALVGRPDRATPVAAEPAHEVTDWLDELCARELVQKRLDSRFPGEAEYSFRNALTREAAYAMLTVEDRKLGHRLAGEWLEQQGEADSAVLAGHFDRGGDAARAVSWYRAAAEDALEGEDLAVVLERAERGIACGATGVELGALRLLQAEVLSWRGARADANARALAAMQLVVHGSQPWYAAAANAISNSSRIGDFELTVQLAERLPPLDLSREVFAPQVVTQARAVADLLQVGKSALAHRLLAPLTALAREQPSLDPEVMAWIENAQAWQALFDGDAGESLKLDEAAARSFERAGDVRNACKAWAGAGYERMLLGRYTEAERALREALAAAERMGLPSLAVNAKHNLGLTLARLGRLDEAVELERAAAQAYGVQQDAKMIGAAHHYLALILKERGELDEAEREADVSRQALAGFPPLLPRALATLAAIHLAQGRREQALAEAREAMAMMQAQGGIEDGEPLIRLIEAETLHATGDTDGARRAIALAAERVLAMAKKISDEVLCRSFLERVPENARILALATAWR